MQFRMQKGGRHFQCLAFMSKLKIIPLGGLEEIGKNMTAIEYEDELFIVDVGLAFPDEDMYGVDIIIPNFDYIRKNKEKLTKVFITHGHEDHIGALPYFMKEFDVKVYATKLTAALIRNKLKGTKVPMNRIQIIDEDSVIKTKHCEVEFFRTNHSIPGCVGVVIQTPLGAVVHTGDFKIDYTPTNNRFIDFQRMGEIGKKGVLVLLSDSTNAEKPGLSISEEVVKQNLKNEIQKCKGRVIVATFASSLHRIQNLFYIAKELNRKIVVFGKSMEKNIKASSKIGELIIPSGTFIGEKEVNQYEPHELIILTTGAQGEINAGLARMAHGLHKNITVQAGDTVMLSSSPIPGNEKTVNAVVNAMLKKGVDVVHGKEKNIHTSGHGHQEDQKLMLSIFKPKYFIPCHGEYKMLLEHNKVAQKVGVKPSHIFMCENGMVVEFDEHGAKINGKVKADAVLVDNSGMGDVDESVMRDRHRLANHGMASILIDCEHEERVKTYVNIRGIVAKYDKIAIAKVISRKVQEKLKAKASMGEIRKFLFQEINELLYEHVKRKPMIELNLYNYKKEKK